jgi:hypothetical protein
MTEKSVWTSEQRLITTNWTKIFFFNKSDTKDMLLSGEQAQISVISVKKGAEIQREKVGVPC